MKPRALLSALDSISRNSLLSFRSRLSPFLLIVLCIFFTWEGFPQITSQSYATENFRIEHYNRVNGLPVDRVWRILGDSTGFIWLGTSDGLVRFDGYSFKTFRPRPQDTTSIGSLESRALLFDNSGQIWATGSLTTSRYDVKNDQFTRYPHLKGSPDSSLFGFPSSLAVIPGEEDVIWIGVYSTRDGESGVSRLDVNTGITKNYTFEDGLFSNIWSLLVDRSGTLWVGSDGGVVHRLDKTSDTFQQYFTSPEIAALGTPDIQEVRNIYEFHRIHALYEDSDGHIWAGKNGGLYLLNDSLKSGKGGTEEDGSQPHFTKFSFKSNSPLSHGNIVAAIYEDREGVLWVGTHGGLYIFDRENKSFIRFPHQPDPFSIRSIYEDRTGILWAGSMQNGFLKMERRKNPFTVYRSTSGDENSLVTGTPSGVLKDKEGIVWIATNALNKINRTTGTIASYYPDPSDSNRLPAGPVDALFLDSDEKMWIGSRFDGLFSYMNGDHFTRLQGPRPDVPLGLGTVSVIDFMEDSAGLLWFSTLNVGMSSLDRRSYEIKTYTPQSHNLGDEWVLKLYEAPSEPGILWAGRIGGLSRFDIAQETFVNYDYLQGISGLLEDRNGDFWLSSNQGYGGLHRFDRATGQVVESFTAEDGLGNSLIYGLFEDKRGYFWLSTKSGISRFDPNSKSFRNFDERDGLPQIYFEHLGTRASKFQSEDGEIFFGGAVGVVSFYPEDLIENSVPPAVVITGLQIGNEPARIGPDEVLEVSMEMTKRITLSSEQNDLTFQFVGLHYTDPGQNKYRYRLEGYEDEWIEAGMQRSARYTSLEPGEYVFHASAANSDGVWNETGTSVLLTILPPWWQTGWAYLLYTMFFLAAGLIASRMYRNRLLSAERERVMTRELEHARQIETQNEQLARQKKRLLELDTAKSRFFANISHEFRTPLTLIMGPLEHLLQQAASSAQRQEISMMQRQAQRLLHLINQLLDLSRLDAGRMTLHAQHLDLVASLRVLSDSFSHRATLQGISCQFDSSVDCAPAYIDPDKFEKIFSNLMSNAFKFTPSGGTIQLSISEEINGEGAYWACMLKDTGEGIPSDELPHIFDRFYQVDTSSTRRYEGSGIGLALTRELVELHKGHIQVESEPGSGTSFVVYFPQSKDPVEDAHEEISGSPIMLALSNGESGSEVEVASPDAPTVLIVEDNTDVRTYLRGYLSTQYQVIEAIDGEEGLERTHASRPDLVIADVMMPRMDGISLCRAIKTDDVLAPIPVILLTARAEEEDRLEGLGTGADDYITKPFSIAELLVRVENLIEVRRALRERFSDELIFKPGDIVVSSEDALFLENMRSAIEAEFKNSTFTVEVLASVLNLSQRQLYRRVKALTGLTPGGLIRAMRLQRAAELLKKNGNRVSEVAYAVGFNDTQNFSRLFRQTFGKTPSEYRD